MSAMNNSSPFDEDRLDAITGMLIEKVDRDARRNVRPHHLALLVSLIVGAVLISTGGTALALTGNLPFIEPPVPPVVSAAPSETPTETPTPTPTPTSTSGPSAATTLNGFDLASVYAACYAAIPPQNWPDGPRPTPDPPRSDSFGVADESRFFAQYDQGDPNAIYIGVYYTFSDGTVVATECIASGDPAAPTITYLRDVD